MRLCVFQLLDATPLTPQEITHYKVLLRRKYRGYLEFKPEKKHRHMLCLYGQDATLIRLLAVKYGITISCLIRIALEIYLLQLEKDLRSERLDVVRHGIKVYSSLKTEISSAPDMDFHNQHLTFNTFKPDDYWPWSKFPFFGFG